MPPTFFKPANSHALAATLADICWAAPKLPCYYYHIPSMTGVAQPMFDLVLAVEGLAPNFAGVKYTGLYTSPGYMDAMRVMAYKGGKYEVLSGREEMMLEGLSIGSTAGGSRRLPCLRAARPARRGAAGLLGFRPPPHPHWRKAPSTPPSWVPTSPIV